MPFKSRTIYFVLKNCIYHWFLGQNILNFFYEAEPKEDELRNHYQNEQDDFELELPNLSHIEAYLGEQIVKIFIDFQTNLDGIIRKQYK